jgi:DNA-binding winged helix-turn-helix (wHTH) protein
MAATPHWVFGPFRLDLDNACVWRGAAHIALRPKTFAVLHYLVAHAGQLVTKEALLEAVWPETAVSDGVLKGCMHELPPMRSLALPAPYPLQPPRRY